MYSKAALDLYPELLKTASAAISAHFKKANVAIDPSYLSQLRSAGKHIIGQAGLPSATAGSFASKAAPTVATAARSLSPLAKGGLLGLGAGALGLGAYALGKHVQSERNNTRRNLAFGAGAATGLALPGMLRGLANTAQNVSLSPNSLFGGGGY